MSYRLEFLGVAEDEINDAVNWYNAKEANLGATFVLAMDNFLNT